MTIPLTTATAATARRPVQVAGLRRALPAVAVHTALRRELRLAGPLVRRTAGAGPGRARAVGAHLDFLLGGLQHHHMLEDDLVWPKLRDRSVEALRLVETMEEQHAHVHDLVGAIAELLPSYVSLTSSVRAVLADLLDELRDALSEHLDLEERAVLPLAERHLTDAEWDEIGARAEPVGPLHERALSFGLIQYEGDPDVLAAMLRTAPLPVRVLLPRLARRAYRRHAITVHGTAMP